MRIRAALLTTSPVQWATLWKARRHFVNGALDQWPSTYARHHGLDLDRLAGFNIVIGQFRAHIEDGRFRFARDSDRTPGKPVVVTEVLDPADAETVIDLVAWRTDDPDHWATILGTPVRQPLAWLQDGAPDYGRLLGEL